MLEPWITHVAEGAETMTLNRVNPVNRPNSVSPVGRPNSAIPRTLLHPLWLAGRLAVRCERSTHGELGFSRLRTRNSGSFRWFSSKSPVSTGRQRPDFYSESPTNESFDENFENDASRSLTTLRSSDILTPGREVWSISGARDRLKTPKGGSISHEQSNGTEYPMEWRAWRGAITVFRGRLGKILHQWRR
jgi:hypothetical protein